MTPQNNLENIRLDYRHIIDLIKPHSRVLDLGCGDGELLSLLRQFKNCKGVGIEISEKDIYASIEKGITVSHIDIDTGLPDYPDKRFDYVILNESLQEVLHPQKVILEALRVGRKVIVGVPNFCHLWARCQLFFRGQVPITSELPYQWYNTPNLRFFSLNDFTDFCKTNAIKICAMRALGLKKQVPFWPNLFAHTGIFLLEK